MTCLASILVILIGSTDLLAVDGCDIYSTVGQDLVVPFIYEKLDLSHVLRWTHNNTIVFYRQRSRVTIGKAKDLSSTGSLTLNNLQFSSSGDYQVVVLNSTNQLVAKWSRRVCVIEKVGKPQLSSLCDFSASALLLNCHVAKTEGVEFSWAIDGKFLSEKQQQLSVSLEKMKAGMSFVCSAANAVSRANSDIVRHACTSSQARQTDNYCFSLQTVQAVFAGGAGLVLLLFTIIITLCCRRQRQSSQRARDVEKFRKRNARTVQEPGSATPDYEIMLSSVKPQGQSSVQDYSIVPQPGDRTANRLSHHPVTEEGGSSPVPKPRTKSPKTANVNYEAVRPQNTGQQVKSLTSVNTVHFRKSEFSHYQMPSSDLDT